MHFSLFWEELVRSDIQMPANQKVAVYFSEPKDWLGRACGSVRGPGLCFPGSCCCSHWLTLRKMKRRPVEGRVSSLPSCWSTSAAWSFPVTPSTGKPKSSKTEKISSGKAVGSLYCQCILQLNKKFYHFSASKSGSIQLYGQSCWSHLVFFFVIFMPYLHSIFF